MRPDEGPPISRRTMLRAAAAAAGLMACAPRRAALPALPARRAAAAGAGTLAERLGYAADARLVILHADDIGLAPPVNAAAIAAFERGAIDSGSVMVPCPAFAPFAAWARTRPGLDLGVHLTFTSTPLTRWRPVLDPARVPSLVDPDGCFPASWGPGRRVRAAEVEAEVRAQIGRARSLGVEPTHLDAHQHVLQRRGPELFEVLVRVAHEERLPFRMARAWLAHPPELAARMDPAVAPLERLVAISPGDATPASWTRWYADQLRALPPGLSELFVHPGLDGAELRALLPDERPWGAAWRQRDLDAVLDPELGAALAAAGVTRVTWGAIRRLL